MSKGVYVAHERGPRTWLGYCQWIKMLCQVDFVYYVENDFYVFVSPETFVLVFL